VHSKITRTKTWGIHRARVNPTLAKKWGNFGHLKSAKYYPRDTTPIIILEKRSEAM
jgi:hypothetical protein